MNILLIDDHFFAREGLTALLTELVPNLAVIEAQTVEAGLEIARINPLNLVFLDIQLPGMGGREGLRLFRAQFPDLGVVMFSGEDRREAVFECLQAGAIGFIPKSMARPEFIDALQGILSGKPYLPSSVLRRSADSGNLPKPAAEKSIPDQKTSASELGLTPREHQVVGWLVQGKSNKEIARRLGIQEQTVRNHLRPIFLKFGVVRRTELMVKVFQLGMIFPPPDIGNPGQ
jgi:DNA-binding NarL/FixJ family response regulator